jgi:5-methylcytosine-specific restriction endonuclease McrA
MEQSKACKQCKQIYSITAFGKRSRNTDGFNTICKTCQTVIHTAYRKANKDKIDAYKKRWAASPRAKEARRQFRLANREKLIAEKKLDFQQNKTKRLATAKKWAEANTEKNKTYQKQYRQQYSKTPEWRDRKRREANKRRAQKLDNGYEDYSEQQVLDLYGTKCHICLLEVDLLAPRKCGELGWQNGLHIDHLMPISKGGPDTLHNVRPAHGKCNLSKWANLYYGEVEK